jgi:hypothetical protein
MASTEREEPGVWQQLRRRRVTRTVVSYLAVGFAFLEGLWLYAPALGFVEDVSRIITGIVVLGFPFAVVLAWTYDVTPQGVVRTPDQVVSSPEETAAPLLRRWVWLLFVAGVLAVGFFFRSLRL